MVGQAVLSPLVADALRSRLGVALPRCLGVATHGRTAPERGALLAQGWQQAHELGLVDSSGRPRPFVEDALKLLDRPDMRIEMVVAELAERRDRVATVCLSGRFAVLARPTPEGLRLEQIPPDATPSALCSLLPTEPAGSGPRSVTLPATALRAVRQSVARDTGQDRFVGVLVRHGASELDARVFARVFGAPRRRLAQVRAGRGGSAQTLDVLDTDAGRYLVRLRGGHLVLTPANTPQLRAAIDELIRVAGRHLTP